MLRLFVLVVLLANGLYFAWTEGLLRPYGLAPAVTGEPQRLTQQMQPQAVQLLGSAEMKKIEAQVQADLVPKECLQAGPFDETQAKALRSALEASLPPGSWQLHTVTDAARWIVYMGKFSTPEAMAKKRAELTALNLTLHPLTNPTLELGFSLGGFDTQADATTELARLSQKGIRTGKVVQERQEGTSVHLRLPTVSEALKPHITTIAPALAGRALRSCE